MHKSIVATSAGAFLALLGIGSTASAADLIWEVESPFRLFKTPASFALHEHAFHRVRGDAASPLPADVVWRLERALNDPDCKDRSSPEKCAATRGPHFDQSRLGWAARTLPVVCYETDGSPRRYPATCDRRYSWGTAHEDYILPPAHTVNIKLSPEHVVDGNCVWTWRPRAQTGKTETRTAPCKNTLTIARVPYSHDHKVSGVAVAVKLPDGREFSDPEVVVDDVLIVALGDSFASGESNPDKPVTLSATRQMVYDPVMNRDDQLASTRSIEEPKFGVASADQGYNWKVLPRRLLEDEEKSLSFPNGSPEFIAAFEKRNAHWFSADCHRSQYGYPFRVGIELTLENRHRSVTLVSFACSGAQVTEGLFLEMPSREGKIAKVRAQLDQLADLMCRGGAAARTQPAAYQLPVFDVGSTSIAMKTINERWCPPSQRKRPIDLVLMSIGGNDVGFGALVLYSMTENASDIAPIAALANQQLRFPPNISRLYLAQLDKRMKAVKDALYDGFGITSDRVVQNAYEPLQYDERGQLCGTQPNLGMDVNPKFLLSKARISEVDAFYKDFMRQLQCISSSRGRTDCPAGLATGPGTGFTLVTEHQVKFAKRGICARNPRNFIADGINMQMLRKSQDEFKPYSPDAWTPYASHWRLFRTPNDVFLTANVHKDGISLFDVLQPGYSALISGAAHPSAEAHAMVADVVMTHARKVLDGRPNITVKPVVIGTTGQN